jgi:hypothetical protein
MLTDEDLIRELEAGFGEEAAGLTYAGRVPTPRRAVAPWTAVPLAAAAAAVVVLPQLGGGGVETPAPGPGPTASAHPSAPLVTRKVDLAAFEAAVARAGDAWPPLIWHIGHVQVPDSATPVDGVEPPTRAWVGVDSDSGLATLWVTTPSRNGGETFAASGEGWSKDQLVHLLLTGER